MEIVFELLKAKQFIPLICAVRRSDRLVASLDGVRIAIGSFQTVSASCPSVMHR